MHFKNANLFILKYSTETSDWYLDFFPKRNAFVILEKFSLNVINRKISEPEYFGK